MARSLATAAAAVAALAALLPSCSAFLPASNPRWPPRYGLQQSLITMLGASQGVFNTSVGAMFGVASFDWSSEKSIWATERPMMCEERLAAAAIANAAAQRNTSSGGGGGNGSGGVSFVYRNLVKALPWFSSVRRLLADPAYEGWFLRFGPPPFPNGTYHVPACDDNYSPPLCSAFYHDQEQTPQLPTPANPNPDGKCAAPACDCGPGIPCGEYLWDHRNTTPVNGLTLQQYLIREHIFDNATGLGHPDIAGLFVDDFWCANIVNGTGACTDPVQGPTEVDRHSQADMGLSDGDIAAITRGWLATMTAAQQAILDAGKYTWSLMVGQANANAGPTRVSAGASCKAFLSRACDAAATPYQSAPLLFGLTPNAAGNGFAQLEADIAAFQLARGPHAYLGWGQWGLTWPGAWTGAGTPVLPLPSALQQDYGTPLGLCAETAPGSSVFSRAWSKATVSLNCSSMEASTTWAA